MKAAHASVLAAMAEEDRTRLDAASTLSELVKLAPGCSSLRGAVEVIGAGESVSLSTLSTSTATTTAIDVSSGTAKRVVELRCGPLEAT